MSRGIYSVRELSPLKGGEHLGSELLLSCLFHRGIKEIKDAQAFLSPSFDDHIHDPFGLSDMDKASDRLVKAIKNNERIVVFADYDADGIPGAVVLHDFFKKAGHENFSVYIPHRHNEGFGLNTLAIKKIIEEGAKLIITVDCGITDVEEVALASEASVDVIITDHHEPGERLPPAYAIVNPKISPNYPEKMLCGAAVAWKLVSAVLSKDRFGVADGFEKWVLDVVGIATLSDMVPLIGENRTLAHFGLIVLRKTKRAGLSLLMRKLYLKQPISEDDIAFMITPRINAASRMGQAELAFKLLTAIDADEAKECIDALEKINKERKTIAAYLSKEVKKVIEAKYSPYFSNKIIVVGNPAWQPSMLGLVAGSVAESHAKPVFLWGREGEGESLKGSCRAPEGVSLTALMSHVTPGVFTDFGGHMQAGGFSVSYDTIHKLEEELEHAYEKARLEEVSLQQSSWIDYECKVEELRDIYLDIKKLAPFGKANEKPVFLIKDATMDSIGFFGKSKEHLKIILKDGDRTVEAVAFFPSEELQKKAEEGAKRGVVGNIESNSFGVSPVRIRIIDIV